MLKFMGGLKPSNGVKNTDWNHAAVALCKDSTKAKQKLKGIGTS
jgi:hypothetical protein